MVHCVVAILTRRNADIAGDAVLIKLPRRTITLLSLLASLLLAAYGQLIIGGADHWTDSWPLLSTFDEKLTELYRAPSYGGEQSAAVAVVLFVLAMALFVWSMRHVPGNVRAREESEQAASEPHLSDWNLPFSWKLLLLVALVLAVGWSYLIVRLVANDYEGWYVALFFCLLALTTLLVGLYDRVRGNELFPQLTVRPWECLVVLGTTGLFAGLVATDLTNWRYATLGDDGAFFGFAKRIVNGEGDFNLFSQAGPAGNHPLLSSAYQAAVMDVAGVNILGWKLATLLVLVATIPVFYVLIRALTNVRTAVFATAIVAFSHYLLGYAHTGYDNVFPLFPTVLAFALFVGGTRRSSLILIFCAGVVAGLGFYTFYSARASIVILTIVLLLMGRKHWKPATVIPIAAGFTLAVAPLFAVEGWNVISEMRAESQSGQSLLQSISSLAASAPRVFLAFNFNPYPIHFVSGSLLDGVSAPLALLGLAYTASRVREDGYRFLLVWFLVAIVVTGLFHPRQEEINSRLHYVLLPMAAFAGLALDRIIALLSSLVPKLGVQPVLTVVCVVGVLPTILGLNLYRHFEESPRRLPALTAALVFREAREPSCARLGERTVVFAAQPFPLMPAVFEFYALEDETPLFFRYDDPPSIYEDAIASGNVGCVLLADPQLADSGPAAAYISQLTSEAVTVEQVSDASGHTTLRVLRLAGP